MSQFGDSSQRVWQATKTFGRMSQDYGKLKYGQAKAWVKRMWQKFKDLLPPPPMQKGSSQDGRSDDQPADAHDIAYYDSDGEQQLLTQELEEALDAWRAAGHHGSVIDLTTNENLTPEGWAAYRLSQSEKEALAKATKKAVPSKLKQLADTTASQAHSDMIIDSAEVTRRVQWLNGRRFDPLDIANLRNSQKSETLTVTKSREVTEMVPVEVPKQHSKVVTHENFVPTLDTGDDIEFVPIDEVSRLLEARPEELAMPREILGRRFVEGELDRPERLERVVDKEIRTWTTQEEQKVPKTRTEKYEEHIKVPSDPHDQLLFILIDWSLSMRGGRIHMALAAATTVIGCHLNDDSRYLYAAFAAEVGPTYEGEGRQGKQALIDHILKGEERFQLLAGTRIDSALRQAADDIRRISKADDHPEILLITDGEQFLTAEEVRAIIRDDITLHTVSIETPNYSLETLSNTYTLLPANV